MLGYLFDENTFKGSYLPQQMGHKVIFQSLSQEPCPGSSIVIIGIPPLVSIEKRPVPSSDLVRFELYKLAAIHIEKPIYDVGNLKPGKTIEDRNSALSLALQELWSKDNIVILLGASDDCTPIIAKAYEKMAPRYNLATVNARFDAQTLQLIFDSKLLGLFNYTALAYQQYFVNQSELDLLSKNDFNWFRLGQLRGNIKEAEPELRDAAIVGFNINSIRFADCPGQVEPSPNGLYAEEACQLGYYSGLGNNTNTFAIFGFQSSADVQGQSAMLIAQLTWYFINGLTLRRPINMDDCRKLIVSLNNFDNEITFYHHQLLDKWWMEIPCVHKNERYTYLVACSADDYNKSCIHEIPERFIQSFRKLN